MTLDGNIAFEIVDVVVPAVQEAKKPIGQGKLNPSKKIGVKVTDIGPGGKEVVRRIQWMKQLLMRDKRIVTTRD